MKAKDLAVGMTVKGKNMFWLTYVVTKINKTTCWVEHRTGENVMKGGKWIDEVFEYKNVRISMLSAV